MRFISLLYSVKKLLFIIIYNFILILNILLVPKNKNQSKFIKNKQYICKIYLLN